MGQTLALFQSSGNFPSESDRLKIWLKYGAITSPESFINFGEMLSGPTPFLHFSFRIFLKTASSVILEKLNSQSTGSRYSEKQGANYSTNLAPLL